MTDMMLRIAFKEWAAVCLALASGRQSIILRKGGIAEESGLFRPEHPRFWLYPTHFHEQQQKGLKPDATAFLDAAVRSRPSAGILRFSHFVDVAEVFHLQRLDQALALDSFHVWTPETATQRFHYRTPGLYALVVRVHEIVSPIESPEHPAYAGCKTWVELDRELRTDGAKPVMTDDAFTRQLDQIRATL